MVAAAINLPTSSLPNQHGISPDNRTWTPPDFSTDPDPLQLVDWHAERSPNHVRHVWEAAEGDAQAQNGLRRMTNAEYRRAVHRCARYLASHLGPNSGNKRYTIAILAAIDSLTYSILYFAIWQLGHVCFPISSRNSAPAVVHLITKVGVTHAIVGGGSMPDLFQQVEQALAKESKQATIQVIEPPTFETIAPQYGPNGPDEPDVELLSPPKKPEMEEPMLILHSSGSTSFPKPIIYRSLHLIQCLAAPWYGEGDACGSVIGAIGIPAFHAMGVHQLVLQPPSTGAIVAVHRPTSPVMVATPENVLAGVEKTRCDSMLAVPAFLEMWSKDPEAIKVLAKVENGVYFGGGPLSRPAGDVLASHGVKIVNLLGMTEAFGVTKYPCNPTGGAEDSAWEYFRFGDWACIRFEAQDDGSGVYELICCTSDIYRPAFFNVPEKQEFATNDLFVQHPKDPTLWRMVGRKDDQIMLSTGEKTNPGPIEGILKQSPFISEAVMFGRAKEQNGVLVQPAPGHEFDPSDENNLTAFRNKIWPKVEEANAFAPQHSRIFKEMILVAKPSKPFQFTPKRTVRRKEMIRIYEDEIEACYKAVEVSSRLSAGIAAPTSWSEPETLGFIRTLVGQILQSGGRRSEVADDADLFSNGFDSLQATHLRNSILSAMRASGVKTVQSVPSGIVFQHPTIASLAAAISAVALSAAAAVGNGVHPSTQSPAAAKVREMEALVKAYTTDLPAHKPDPARGAAESGKETVLVTGTTGGLGSHLLAQLVAMESVEKVYAMNRRAKDGRSLMERQEAAFTERLGSAAAAGKVLQSAKLVLVEAATEKEDLDVQPVLLEEIRSSTTLIIHNAWRLDFNLALASFKPQLDSVANLVRLALGSSRSTPPRIVFISSIGVTSSWTSPGFVPEEPLPDLKIAVGGGYGEAKATAERILERVAETTAVKTLNIRVGQLAGSTCSGAWATTDWLPMLVKSAEDLGCLPGGQGSITWLPVDIAASAILDFRHSACQTLHIVHPNPCPWSEAARVFSSSLGAPLVPYAEWLRRLTERADDPNAAATNPAVKLADFYGHGTTEVDGEHEIMGLPRLSTDKATRESASLRNVPRLDAEDVESWIAFWRRTGFLRPQAADVRSG